MITRLPLIAIALTTSALLNGCTEDMSESSVETSSAAQSHATASAKEVGALSSLNSLPGPLFPRTGYDYAPSIIQVGSIRKYWWCGYIEGKADTIQYRVQDSAGNFSPPITVFERSEELGAWDSIHACDPSVVMGQFVNPDDQKTYGYAMYYTATDRGADHPVPDSYGRIGVAYSLDGVEWVRYSGNPIVSPRVSPTNAYGAGQASVINTNGAAGVWMIYTDISDNADPQYTDYREKIFYRTTVDGVHFSAPTEVSTSGVLPGQTVRIGNADFGYDYVGNFIYAAFAFAVPTPNEPSWLPGGHRVVDGQNERERYIFGLYRMPGNDFPSGTWENLGFVDTNSTGKTINHNVGLVRDVFGNVNVTLPAIEMVYAAGEGIDTSTVNAAHTWDLYSSVWNSGSPRLPLNRYYNPVSVTHRVTTGEASGFTFEQTLGYLLRGRAAGTVPLYGCQIGTTNRYFVSLDGTCEGFRPLGINGFIYTSPPSQPYVQLFRCVAGNSIFVSTNANCEGQGNQGSIGYALAS